MTKKTEKTMMEKVLVRAKEQGFEWYKDNGTILLSIDEMLKDDWVSVDDPATAEMTISDYDKKEGKAYIYKVDHQGFLRDRIAAIWKKGKGPLIEEMKDSRIILEAEWLEENDPEMLDWITSSKYWGRGYEEKPHRSKAVVELYFDEGGVEYKATFEDHPNGVKQSLNNQGPWGEDSWEDWTAENIKKYYELIK